MISSATSLLIGVTISHAGSELHQSNLLLFYLYMLLSQAHNKNKIITNFHTFTHPPRRKIPESWKLLLVWPYQLLIRFPARNHNQLSCNHASLRATTPVSQRRSCRRRRGQYRDGPAPLRRRLPLPVAHVTSPRFDCPDTRTPWWHLD